jgi:hypothetical protein
MTVCDCGLKEERLLQLYVPSLPEKVRALLPSFEGLIVFTNCTECMGCDIACSTRAYAGNQFVELILDPPRDGSQIEPRTVTNWEEFVSYDFTSDRAYELNRESGKDEIQSEETGRLLRKVAHAPTFLVGNPRFKQGEYSPCDNYGLLVNFAQDNGCSCSGVMQERLSFRRRQGLNSVSPI